VEAVADGKDLGKCGDRFFGAVFLVAGNQHHLLPAAGSMPAWEVQRTLRANAAAAIRKGRLRVNTVVTKPLCLTGLNDW
jgi:hypothetical protein